MFKAPSIRKHSAGRNDDADPAVLNPEDRERLYTSILFRASHYPSRDTSEAFGHPMS